MLVIGIQGAELNDQVPDSIRELGAPLRMKPFAETKRPSLRNIRYRSDTQMNYYSVEVGFSDASLRFELSYYLKISEKPQEGTPSCGFKYRFNHSVLPMLVKRGELLGALVCGGELTPERPVVAYCYGQVQLAYPFLPLPIILLRDDDMFLVQLCARKFPDFNGAPYKFPTIPPSQDLTLNNTLFQVTRSKSESGGSVLVYKMRRLPEIIECILNKLFHGKGFQVVEFSIVGVISCKVRCKDRRAKIQREIIRALCSGISNFLPGDPDSHASGTFKMDKGHTFNTINCVSLPEKLVDLRLKDPDQAIKDSLLQMNDK
ncbi:hypothetical protein OIY81_2689 [Cryptosporidium canis]|nr:hypothetical protein OIY81_2689 [Cryptosporidium canis]